MEFKPGDVVQAFFQDKWQTATVINYGRKWTHVKFAHRARNTKLPATGLREIRKLEPIKLTPKVQTGPVVQARYGNPEDLHMDHFDMFFRIRDGSRPIATITAYYKEEAMVMFEAVKKFRALLTEPVPATPTEIPLPTPMVNLVKPEAITKPLIPVPPKPAPAPVEQPKKRRGRPSKKPNELVF